MDAKCFLDYQIPWIFSVALKCFLGSEVFVKCHKPSFIIQWHFWNSKGKIKKTFFRNKSSGKIFRLQTKCLEKIWFGFKRLKNYGMCSTDKSVWDLKDQTQMTVMRLVAVDRKIIAVCSTDKRIWVYTTKTKWRW